MIGHARHNSFENFFLCINRLIDIALYVKRSKGLILYPEYIIIIIEVAIFSIYNCQVYTTI